MIDREALLKDLQRQVKALEPALLERVDEDAETGARLRAEWERAREAERIAASFESWLGERVTQVAVAWVLGTVFLRFCEDNGLVELPFLSGPGDRLALAQERQGEFIHADPLSTDRDWILAGFEEMSRSRVAAGLFDRAHNPMWHIELPHHAAKELLGFWRRRGEDGEVVHDFTDPAWDTRFLGDLYQDLSEDAKKRYALLQTPEFVEEFILDYTLEPAVEEFGLTEEMRTIDPTCGSGHFLLGLFHRLLGKWRDAEPGTDSWTLIRRALSSVHGVDKNPFAVAIARFRLLVAAMQAAGEKHLASAPDFPLLIAVGDSLLHGRGAPGVQEKIDLFDEAPQVHTYTTEDIYDYMDAVDLLGNGSYHVVVGNPPYITVKDKQENANYRKAYETCSGTYALTVPFAERFFQLALRASGNLRSSGYVGQITANSFMKREFGKQLIEDFFSQKVQLTHIVDTSGAYIPGHGTPTLIIFGRNMVALSGVPVRTAMGIQGEPRPPDDASKGLVWTSIVAQFNAPGSPPSKWISVRDLDRFRYFWRHPWILEYGALELVEQLDAVGAKNISSIVDAIGRTTHTGLDDGFFLPASTVRTQAMETDCVVLVTGLDVRDFVLQQRAFTIFPYGIDGSSRDLGRRAYRQLWSYRVMLSRRVDYQQTLEERGLRWYDHSMFFPRRFRSPLSVAFVFIATHNHFVLDRGGKVFNRHAPVIKLPEGASEEEHLELLAILNSSTACFWLKQVSHNKGSTVDTRGARQTTIPWENFYEFTGTKLEQFPLPAELPLEFGRELDRLAQRLSALEPSAVCEQGTPTRERLDAARTEHAHVRGRMISLQEELDWEVYRLYGLLSDGEAASLRADPESVPELKLGERAFEIVLARKMAAGELQTEWFARHGSTPITELPVHWPEAYRKVVEARIKAIEWRRDIGLIERPECKRRWSTEPWEKKEQEALRTWLLDRCEDRSLWFTPDEYGIDQPRPQTVNQLADKLRRDPDVVSVARLYAAATDRPDADLATVLAEIVQDEHVPYLAQLRYKPSGLAKRKQWESVWDQQREEDRLTAEKGKEVRLDIPVPPKYTSADFAKPSYWRQRGKLDVPKERFISYPHASPETDESLLLGWAGWDHKEQALALTTLIEDRSTRDGWDTARLTPLIAGLAEVMPWVRQWHSDIDPTYGQSWAASFDTYLDTKQHEHGLSTDDLRTWRPPASTRGRRKRTTT